MTEGNINYNIQEQVAWMLAVVTGDTGGFVSMVFDKEEVKSCFFCRLIQQDDYRLLRCEAT